MKSPLDFRSVLARSRATAYPGSPNGGTKTGFNLFLYWQGQYWQQAAEDMPIAVKHAYSIAFALDQIRVVCPDDQMFFGGNELFRTDTLPDSISSTDFDHFTNVTLENIVRTFRCGWDHTVPDYRELMTNGLGSFIRRAEAAHQKFSSPQSEAMLISLLAVQKFLRRAAAELAASRPELARMLGNISDAPPADFAEALQLMWIIFVILEAQKRHHMALARMDQYLYPAFAVSKLSHDEALDMICHIFSKVEDFHEVTNICAGGVKPDGSDASNELSLLIIEAVGIVRSPSTNLSARLYPGTPEKFLMACCKLISSGIGFPAIMNDDVYINSLHRTGVPLEFARDYALFGCVEGNIPGLAPAWSDSRFALPETFCEVLNDLAVFSTYDEFFTAFAAAVKKGMRKHLEWYNSLLKERPAERFPDPLLSALTGDCISRGLDINAGGARFPRRHGVGMIGLATIANSLMALKKLYFEEKRFSAAELLDTLKRDFDGAEDFRQMLLNDAPKYGNDIPEVDAIAADVVRICGESSSDLRIDGGGYMQSAMASNVQNISAGKTIPATPDGRHAGTPLSDAASPDGGQDRNGPTAFINSVTTPDYSVQNCTVVNMRFRPEMFESSTGLHRLAALLRAFISGGGHEIQFNVTNNDTLLEAIANPEKFGDLIVRISGFSARFTLLRPEIQQDIIRRNAHL